MRSRWISLNLTKIVRELLVYVKIGNISMWISFKLIGVGISLVDLLIELLASVPRGGESPSMGWLAYGSTQTV